MLSRNIKMENIAVNMPYQIMRGHTSNVNSVVHLSSGIQIGSDWRDGTDEVEMFTIALSPNSNTVASGSGDGTVRLWDVETGKVSIKCKWHTDNLGSVCWSADGDRVMSGFRDGTARVWDVKSNGIVSGLIKTGDLNVFAVIYSPDSTKIATGSYSGDGVIIRICDAKTGELLTTIKHQSWVFSLAWTSDGQKLISGSYGPIRIFDTATLQQMATLEGHTNVVHAITLSQNDRLLASVSSDKTARLWDLDTNLPVGPPLFHTHSVQCAALSTDGTVLITGSNKNVYAWDVHAILKKAGLEHLLIIPNVVAGTLSTDADHMQRSTQLEDTHSPLQGYIIEDTSSVRSSVMRYHSDNDETVQFQQPSRQNSISHCVRSLVGFAAVKDKGALYVAPRPRPQHAQTTSTSAPPHATATPGTATV